MMRMDGKDGERLSAASSGRASRGRADVLDPDSAMAAWPYNIQPSHDFCQGSAILMLIMHRRIDDLYT